MEQDNQHISDQEIRRLLKKRLLEADASDHLAERLLEAEAKLAFGFDALVNPPAQKEAEFLKKHSKINNTNRFKKWLFPGASLFIVTVAAFLLFKTGAVAPEHSSPEGKAATKQNDHADTASSSAETPAAPENTDTSKTILNEKPQGKIQVIDPILKENADCNHPIYVTDTIVFSPHSPAGTGNELEIKGHAPDDPMYFEKEHNTVWYKYVAPESGQLTFDIIPVDPEDDYDFMLYKWDGGDFHAKLMTDKIKPVRACISRNDKSLKSMTGLHIDAQMPSFIHSGEGASYVRHIDVNKHDVFYLLVDNVYAQGNGHTVEFHLKRYTQGAFFVGQSIMFQKITFQDGDIKFKKGSEKELDSLYRFLLHYPNIKIEIDGHTNPGSYMVLIGDHYPEAMELSRVRAETIAAYLVKRGIDPKRLTTKGYGYGKPIIKNPKTIKENILNVRAEIVILSVDYQAESGKVAAKN